MYKTINRLIAILLIFIVVSKCYSGKIYLNPTSGNDTASGRNILYPIKTLTRAGIVCINNDTILIRQGTHLHVYDQFRRYGAQDGWVYIMPYPGETVILDGSNDPIPNWDGIIRIESSRKVSIKGLTIRNNLNAGLGIFVNSFFSISQYILIDSCIIYNTAKHGILIQGSNTIVNNCEISNAVMRNQNQVGCSWDQALSSYVDINQSAYLNYNITFSNNKIHNCWGEGIGLIRTDTFLIKNNTVHDCYSAYIYCDNSYNGKINGNWIYSTNDVYNRTCFFPTGYSAPGNGIFWAAEGGGGYALNRMIENIDIYNNLIIRTSAAFGWFDDTANNYPNDTYRNINIYFNTVYNTIAYETFYLDNNINRVHPPANSCRFKNNIICKGFYNNTFQNYINTSNVDYQNAWMPIEKNCFIQGNIPINISGNISGNPAFINPNINLPTNFKIDSTSICRNYGLPIPGIATDYFNAIRNINTPCIGFHEFGGIPSGIEKMENTIPEKFQLYQNYPNPFNPNTTIKFDVFDKSLIRLTVFEITGKEVEVLVNQVLDAGKYKLIWNAKNASSGIYFLRLETNDFLQTQKMNLLK